MPFGKREPGGYHGYDRRQTVRWEGSQSAVFILPNAQTMPCVIRDFSNTGARVELLSTFGLNNNLVLKFSDQREWIRITWTTNHQMGVEFV